MADVQEGVDKLLRGHHDREHDTILNWLTSIDYASRQSDLITRCQEGTGEWLLRSNEFREWVDQDKRTIFCPGIPGAGKTMITSIVVHDLYKRFRSDDRIGIAYLYCEFRRKHEQKAIDLLASLLKQLAQEQPTTPACIKSLYGRHKDKRTCPSFDEISKALHSVIAGYLKTFIVIDALDECQVSDGNCRTFLSEIFNLQAKTGASLFVTSRPIQEIEKEFEGRSVWLEIRANNEDLYRYLNGRIAELSRSGISKYPLLQDKIKSEIVKTANGMFLLAHLQMNSLMDQPTPGDIELALQNLPTGLDGTYEQAMERIKSQGEGFRKLAIRVLFWITHAKRPLSTDELRHALAVGDGGLKLDEKFLPEVQVLGSICAGLVTIDEKSDIVRLVHYTTQEYFQRSRKNWFPDAETHISRTCVTYLSFDTFKTGFCQTDEEFEERLRLNPFYDYAARNWAYHASSASHEVERLILKLLESKSKVSSSSQAMMASGTYQGYSQRGPRQMTGLHLAAYFGLENVIRTLLRGKVEINLRDAYKRTALSHAAKEGHEAVVKLLLDRKSIDFNSEDNSGCTALSLAAAGGHEAVVKLLLDEESIDFNSKDNSGWTALFHAAMSGHEAAVKLLLDKEGIDFNSKDDHGRTALSYAAANGHEAVVKLLLGKKGIGFNSKSKYVDTALSYAAANGHEAVVKLLLDKEGIDFNSRGKYGRTALSYAAERGSKVVVKLVLDKEGIDFNFKDGGGRTPLYYAAVEGHEAVVKLLLDKE
ncbi:hypothetical protein GP486_007496, partial [Trichoglossum hirsutum]